MHTIHLAHVVIQIGKVVLLIHILVNSFEAMKLMIYVQNADIAVTVREFNTAVQPAVVFHDFWLDPNVLSFFIAVSERSFRAHLLALNSWYSTYDREDHAMLYLNWHWVSQRRHHVLGPWLRVERFVPRTLELRWQVLLNHQNQYI